MTTLPERLRASAQAMRGLFLVSENVPNFRVIYKDDRDRIARELEEAAVALEAWPTEGFVIVPKEPTPEMVRSGQIGVTTSWVRDVYAAMLAAAPSAHVAQEGGGVLESVNNCSTCRYKHHPDGGHCYMFRIEPEGRCAKHTAAAGVATDGGAKK